MYLLQYKCIGSAWKDTPTPLDMRAAECGYEPFSSTNCTVRAWNTVEGDEMISSQINTKCGGKLIFQHTNAVFLQIVYNNNHIG